MRILTLAVYRNAERISAHSVQMPAPPNHGGTIVTVYPGGSYLGLSFAALQDLGSGRHELLECDEHDVLNPGVAPIRSPREDLLEQFEETLFAYQQGAFTTLEVLAEAQRVLTSIAQASEADERAQP